MSSTLIQKYQLNNWNQLHIHIDDSPSYPREWGQTKMCIREHRHYLFPNELDYDFDSAAEDAEKLYEQYYIFELDCYIHSWVSFSLAWRFDTSNNCGFIAVPKEINWYDWQLWSESKNKEHANAKHIIYTEEEARETAQSEIKQYNQWGNWEVYWYTIMKNTTWTSADGRVKDKLEVEDSCRWFYDIQDIITKHAALDPKEIN